MYIVFVNINIYMLFCIWKNLTIFSMKNRKNNDFKKRKNGFLSFQHELQFGSQEGSQIYI